MSVATKERDTATAKRNDVQSNSKKQYNTSCTRSTRLSDEEIAKKWMVETFGFWMERWTIDPEMAQEILDNMGLNRKIKTSGVLKYTAIIQKGRWWLSPEGIVFDEHDRLMDGQHRLQAVIDSGIPTDFTVFRGVSKDMPIDKGIVRSDADSQRIRGLLPADLARTDNNSIANAVFSVTLTSTEYHAINEDDRAAFISKYADEITFARLASGKGESHGIAKKAGIRAAILAAVICGVDRDAIEELVVSINTMCFDRTSPARVMYKTLDHMDMAGAVSIASLEGMMEEAIYDYVHGKPRTQRYTGKNHPYAKKIPVREVIA